MIAHKYPLLALMLGSVLALTGMASSASASAIATATPPALAATIRLVKPGGLTEGDCQAAWANACELRYALTLAAVLAGDDEIWAVRGIYTPGVTISSTFILTNGVALYGGFAMTETARAQRHWTANVTVLSGDIDGDDIADANGVVTDTANIRGNNTYHVVTTSGVTNTAILDGFAITGGRATGTHPTHDGGGGMFNNGGSPALTNVTFSGNSATDYGGGMFNNGGSPALTNITFSGNSATYGGGMCNDAYSRPTLTNVTFSGNSATYGGGMFNDLSNSVLTNITFTGNSATYGGGMYNQLEKPTLTNITFSGNFAGSYGGGMANNYSSPTLTNVTFSSNSADNEGGGMVNETSSPTLTNVTFSNNSADNGGGMYTEYSSSPTVRNTLFVKGTQGNNCGGDAFATGSTHNLADDDSCGSSASQSANINLGMLGNYGGSTQTIPLFIGSAAIDAGNTTYCLLTDQRGFRRVGQCDIGAYEAPRWVFLPLALKNYEFFFEGPAEAEDNDEYTSANGPLRAGQVYTGAFNDAKDYFSVRLSAAGPITVDVTHSSSGVQLQLFYQVVDEAHRVKADTTGHQVDYSGAAGWYYVYLYAASPDNSTYTLQVTYP